MTEPREEAFGLRPVKTGVTQPHALQWIDPTFDEAQPVIDAWLSGRATDEKEAA